MKKVIILGTGGHARVVSAILSFDKEVEVVGFIDEGFKNDELISGKKEIGGFLLLPKLFRKGVNHVCLAIGDNQERSKLFEKAKRMGFKIVSAVHPSSVIAPDVKLGEGVVICPGAILCTLCQVGDNAIINTGTTIDHETIIGKHCHIAPGVSVAGRVKIGDFSLLGIGSSVIPHIKIGKKVTIGAGAVVVDNIPDNSVAVGVPAKVIKKKPEL